MNLRLIRHLLTRTLRGKRLLGTVALASVGGIGAWVTTAGEPSDGVIGVFQSVMATAPAATLSIAVLLVATATLRDERDGGTLGYIYLSPMSALSFATSSMVAALMAGLMVAFLGWIPAWVGIGLVTGSWTVAVPALALYLTAAVGYAAVFAPLGYLFDRSLIIGLAYIFVWEGILASAVSGLGPSSIWRIALSSYADLESLPRDALDVLGSVTPGAGGATVTVLVLVGLATGMLTWAVRFRDAV